MSVAVLNCFLVVLGQNNHCVQSQSQFSMLDIRRHHETVDYNLVVAGVVGRTLVQRSQLVVLSAPSMPQIRYQNLTIAAFDGVRLQ